MAVEADKQWTRRCIQEYHKLASQYQMSQDLQSMKRLGWQKSYREQDWQDTTNNLKFNNTNPFKNTNSLQKNTRSIYDNSNGTS